MLRLRTLGVFGFVLSGLWVGATGADVRLAGTDLLGADFSHAMHTALFKESVGVSAVFDGSRPGAKALRTSRVDLALLTLPDDELESLATLASEPLAYHALAVAVPQDCPIQQITLAQLASVFGDRGSTRIATWGDLGAQGEWQTAAIVGMAPETGAGVALEYFRRLALEGAPLRSNVMRFRDEAELRACFGTGSRVLAIVGFVPAGLTTMRLLPVASQPGGPAVLPTADTLHAGDYPVRLPLRMFVRRERMDRAAPLVRWLRSDEAAAAFARAGLVPVPAAVRAARGETLETVDRVRQK